MTYGKLEASKNKYIENKNKKFSNASSDYLKDIKEIWQSPEKLMTDAEYQKLLESESDTNPEFMKALEDFKEENSKRDSEEVISELAKLGD
jgi:hemerythrin